MLGINSRDLGDLSVSLDRAVSIIRAVRGGKANIVVAESGVKTVNDALKLAKEGANAVLVGTALMRDAELAKDLSSVAIK